MRHLPATFRVLLALALALGAAGCASTKWVSTWSNPDVAQIEPLGKILVIGVAKQPANRRIFEDQMVAALARADVNAVQSYSVLGDEKQSEEQLRATVRDGGFDGVVLTRLAGTEERTRYVPGSSVSVGYGPYWGPYGGYSAWYSTAYAPGYLVNEKIVSLETQAWAAAGDGTLVWSGLSETVDPTSVPSVCRTLSSQVVSKLRKAGVI